MTIARRLLKQRLSEVAGLTKEPVLDVGGERHSSVPSCDEYQLRGSRWYVVNIVARFQPDVVASGYELPFADGAFNSVLALELLEHLKKPRLMLAEAFRVLRPEGRLIVSMPFLYRHHRAPDDYQRWTHEKIFEELEERLGFVVDVCVPRGGWLATVLDMLTQGLGAFVPGTFWGSRLLYLLGRAASWGIEVTFPLWMEVDRFLSREERTRSVFHRFTTGYVVVARKSGGSVGRRRGSVASRDVLRFPRTYSAHREAGQAGVAGASE